MTAGLPRYLAPPRLTRARLGWLVIVWHARLSHSTHDHAQGGLARSLNIGLTCFLTIQTLGAAG